MLSVVKTGGGAFDPTEKNTYFIASNVERMKYGARCHNHLLIAVNEIKSVLDIRTVEGWIDGGAKVFIDSGIYNLAVTHAERHNLTMDVALSTAPELIDGFEILYQKYITLIKRFGERSWGYIELDMGDSENKVKTRVKLEVEGLRPIPVYHPFNDGWDYFDELCQRYDRICFGNVVMADVQTRKRLVATAWERRRKYPHVWIHLLGLTPSQTLMAFPINSGDSSAWLAAVRWSGYKERVGLASFGSMPNTYQYQLGSDAASPQGSRKATMMAGYGSYINQLNWQHHLNDLEALGGDRYAQNDH